MRKTSIVLITILFLLLSRDGMTSQMTGCVARDGAFATVRSRVDIQCSADGYFRNEAISIKGHPLRCNPSLTNDLCFDLDDDRFVVVQAFYYGTEFLQYYNDLLQQLSLPPVHDIAVKLQKAPEGVEPSGATIKTTSGVTILLNFANAALDPSIIGHELGHAIHFSLLKKQIEEIFSSSSSALIASRSGVLEGTANLLAALYFGEATIAKRDWFDASVNLDVFVRFPDLVPTIRDHFQHKIDSLLFSTRYKTTAATLKSWIVYPPVEVRDLLDEPDPYLASAVINQPMWNAAVLFGFRNVQLVYLAAIFRLQDFSGYSDLGRAIIEEARKQSEELGDYFTLEFRHRGLVVD